MARWVVVTRACRRMGIGLLATVLWWSAPAQSPAGSPQLTHELQLAEQAMKANEQTAATEHFRAALKQDPNNLEAHANLGAIAFVQGDCKAAEPELREALRVSPSLVRAQALISLCERRLDEPGAQTDMESAFARLDDAKLKMQLGAALADMDYQRGDLGQTATVLHSLLEVEPDNVDMLFFAQRVYSELADNTLNKLALLAPGSARMEQLIAERLINAGDLKGAAIHYRKALAANSKLPGVHYELAETLMEDSPNDAATQKEAVSELEAATQADGDSAKTESELGRIALLQSKTAEALAHYTHAYELDPKDAQAQMGLADLLRTENKPEEAAEYLRMAVKEDPLNAEAHYKLSQVARLLHREDEQKKELQLFLEIRATRDKVKQLYREMNPRAALTSDAAADGAQP
jgi:tetratricopeptide (TPR) repeat protein